MGGGRGITRRAMLVRTGGLTVLALGGSGLLAACGGDDGDDDPTTSAAAAPSSADNAASTASSSEAAASSAAPATGAPGTTGTAVSSTAGAAPTPSGTLNFLGYEGDDFPDFMPAWLESAGGTFEAAYISDESELIAKLPTGGLDGIDLISFTTAWSPYLIDAQMLQPLDPAKLPNLADVWPYIQDAPSGFFRDASGAWVATPAYWGSIGIAWDTTVVPEITAWDDILAPELTGKVGMIDFPAIHLQVVGTIKGFDPARMTDADLQTFKDYMVPVVKQAKTLTASFGDLISLLGSKELAAVFPGYTFIAGGAIAQGNADVSLNIALSEGSPLLSEMFGIPVGADNADSAYAWINETLAPATAAKIAEAQGSIVTVTQGVDLLSPDTRALYPYDTLDAFLAKGSFLSSPPPQSDEFVSSAKLQDAWTQIKQEAGQ